MIQVALGHALETTRLLALAPTGKLNASSLLLGPRLGWDSPSYRWRDPRSPTPSGRHPQREREPNRGRALL